MIDEKVIIDISGKKIEVIKGTTLKELSKNYQDKYNLPIILAKVDGVYKELSVSIKRECKIEFLTLEDKEANRVYVNGLVFLTMYAASKCLKGNRLIVQHSIDKGLYIQSVKKITLDDVKKLKDTMKDIIKLNLPIERLNVNRKDALDYYNSINDDKKVDLLRYNTSNFITLYKLGNLYDYFFSLMPVETRCLERFDLKYLNEHGFVLLFQTVYMKDGIKSYQHHEKVFDVFEQYHNWTSIMNVDYVSSLNNVVSSGNVGDLIRISEVLQSNNLLQIARQIVESRPKIKIVLIAGPSSSGKTTTCNKLAMYLRSFGLKPKTISMDNYFLPREKTPRDENGNFDFECLDALDLKLFNKQITDLNAGKEVRLPIFDFITGHQDLVSGEVIQLKDDDILIIEGIHALNSELLQEVPRKNKFKIYISPFTCLNLDYQNRISTADNRLLRRIIRDNTHRGYNAENTLRAWESVRRGEEKNIFPYQDEADALFNTSLIYEMGVLKTYAAPLLYLVDIDSPYYMDAKRLIDLLKMFMPIPSEDIPKDSLLREFIGGGCFKQ